MLRQLFDALLLSGWAGACCAVLIVPARRLAGGRVAAATLHHAHLAALLLSLLPVAAALRALYALAHPFTAQELPLPGAAAINDAASPALPLAETSPDTWVPLLLGLLPFVWLLGALLFALYQLLAHRHAHRTLRRWSAPLDDGQALRALQALCEELGVRVAPRLRLCPGLASPLLTGLRRPTILLPAPPESAQELEFILRHELTHLARRDLWAKLLALAARAVHWYNPFIHLLAHSAGQQMELACDAGVARGLSFEQRRAYGHAILRAVAAPTSRRTGLSASLCEDAKHIKRRLLLMLHSKKTTGKARFAGVLALVLVLAGATGVAAATFQPTQDDVVDVNLFELIPLGVAPDPVADSVEYTPAINVNPASPLDVAGEDSLVGEDRPEHTSAFLWPTDGGVISLGLGAYDGHTGADIPRPEGSPIYAVAAGTVVVSRETEVGYGNYILLDHCDGVQTLYAHNSANYVAVGDVVAAGQTIGAVGRSGNSTGYQLHFEIRIDGRILDPEDFLTAPQ